MSLRTILNNLSMFVNSKRCFNFMGLNSPFHMKAKWFYMLLVILWLNPFTVDAQKQAIVKVEGEAQVRIENNESRDNAMQRAEELAILDAIQNAFGTYVEQSTDMYVEDGKVNYSILAGTKMKADWIRTNRIKFSYPEQTSNLKEKIIWIKCNIEGEAREMHSKANLDILTLRCPQKECAATDFKNKQSLYLYFKAPVDGYLSVFLDEGEITRRILPYEQMENHSAVWVEGDKEYIFFQKPKGTAVSGIIDELELYTTKPYEYNTIYVVFSEEPYVKPILEKSVPTENEYIIPKNLPSLTFKEWLSDSRAASASFQDKKIKIRISKK